MKSITLRYAFILAFVALICATASSGVYFLTKDRIQHAIDNQQKELLLQVVPQSYFDNDLLASCSLPPSHLTGINKLYRATLAGNLTAYAFETTAPDGYSGDIRLLVGLTPKGEILGVRTLEHHETPGLGDKIETRISDWILSFTHQFLHSDNLQDWAVKKDGGKFDQFAGATITPRAVVNQVKRASLNLLEKLDHNLELVPCP
ncbi:electron transport complex subunit RsxG [Conservatibacter flavescens]|uniref:Ion-translocating oxidoreductase complex subunit G n=1 Tax=Conservatibacter flavescens TaxID=28161 RepID=A0A2M8S039_9PAST|nr:electron transport complex subunit RsxG [Conservatibacter flavescens]PJG84476.1 electron transport complex subunit RsxG [Conservatibacter flavescens]